MSARIALGLLAAAAVAALDCGAAGGLARKPVAGGRVTAMTSAAPAVYVNGANNSSQLGVGVTTQYGTVIVDGYPRSVAVGDNHVIVALDDGSVQAWGAVQPYTGRSAGGSDGNPLTIAYPLVRNAGQVAAGSFASYILTQAGQLFALGYNDAGQLGNGSIGGSSSVPNEINGLANIAYVDARCNSAAAIDATGRLFTWGSNLDGQLGIGATGGSSGTPTHILSDVAQVAVGCNFMLARLRNGQVYGWGANNEGQLGQNNTIPRSTPTLIPISNVASVTAGNYHALAVMNDGRLSAWGRNFEGQLGLGTFTAMQLTPVLVPGVLTAYFTAAGSYHSLVAQQDSTDATNVYATGANDQGQVTGTVGASRATFTPYGRTHVPPSSRRTGLRDPTASDLFWMNTASGETGYWQGAGTPTNTYRPLRVISPAWSVVGTGDINFDDYTEVFFYNASTGEVYFWSPTGQYLDSRGSVRIADEGSIGIVDPFSGWRPHRIGDFDGDGASDILWRNSNNGAIAIWFLNADARVVGQFEAGVTPGWTPVQTGDFDGNGVDDILWRNSSGEIRAWFRTHIRSQNLEFIFGTVPVQWVPQVSADLDGDGRVDLFWRNVNTGQTFIWYMMGGTYHGAAGPTVADLAWNAVATSQNVSPFSSGAQSAIIWRHGGTGEVYHWSLGTRGGATFSVESQSSLGAVPLSWRIGQQ